MSTLAGIYYFDRRPISAADEAQVRRALGDFDRQPLHCFRSHGLIMGVAGSPSGSSEDDIFSLLPDGSVCTWDGRLDNRGCAVGLRLRLPTALHQQRLGRQGVSAQGSRRFPRFGRGLEPGFLGRQLAQCCAGQRLCRHTPAVLLPKGRSPAFWSSSLSGLIRWTGVNELDEEYVANFLTHGSAAHRTPYRGVYPVPPGCAVSVSPDRIATQSFWDLPVGQEVRLRDDRGYEEQLRALFQEAVSVRLKSQGPVCAELSGGLDSSSVVCMAAQLKNADPGGFPELITLTYTQEGSTDEKYFRTVERVCNLSSIYLQLEEFPIVAGNLVGGAVPAWWEARFRELARLMASLGSSVFLTGQFGDFIMGNLVERLRPGCGLPAALSVSASGARGVLVEPIAAGADLFHSVARPANELFLLGSPQRRHNLERPLQAHRFPRAGVSQTGRPQRLQSTGRTALASGQPRPPGALPHTE